MAVHTSPLDHVRVATPCSARWEEMVGDDRTRFCSQCSLNVYNLSAMRRDEAEELVASTEGRLCVRFYRRSDGSIITQDCPVGVQAVRQRRFRRIRNTVAGTAALIAGTIGLDSSRLSWASGHKMGKMVIVPPAPSQVDSSIQINTDEEQGDVMVVMGDTTVPIEIMGKMEAPDDDTVSVEEPTVTVIGELAMPENPISLQPATDPDSVVVIGQTFVVTDDSVHTPKGMVPDQTPRPDIR